MHLGQVLGQELPVPPHDAGGHKQVSSHTRRRPKSDFADDAASAPFFDESKVPVHTIEVPNPEVNELGADQYEVIGEKTSYRLAQRPGSYVVLKHVRPVINVAIATGIAHPPERPEVGHRRHLRTAEGGVAVAHSA